MQYGSIAAGSVLVFLGILIAVNWISNRQNKRWDLTDTKQFSLSDQTKQIITTLKAPLSITVFYQGKQGDTSQNYRDRLEAYQYLSKQVSLDFIDVDKQPTEADKNAVTAVPTLIVKYGGRTQRATSADEQAVTNALKKVIEGTAKRAYFTEGHGERDLDDQSSRGGFAAISNAIKDDNFDVAKLQIAQKGSIPADATVLVIAGPTGDFLPQEVDLVRGYLKNGGKVMLMLDPPAKGGTVQATSLIALAKEWGMQVGEDIVIDPNGQQIGADASVPVGMPVPSQPITKDFKRISAFPIARSVIPVTGGVDGKTAQTFVQTGPASWSEADVKGLYATGVPKKELDKGDKNGPVSIGAAASAPATGAAGAAAESRIVVFGDSDFASNNYASVQGNGDLFLNAMNWLAQQENLISIRPKNPEDRRLQLTADQQQRVNWFTLAIMPLLLFGNAFRLYWKRR
jgi:ABC-type uncharacterized transport system involved in gliding motility auxiliary subunit